eukprot:8685295-Alexandrium_andersonii.AAC.1
MAGGGPGGSAWPATPPSASPGSADSRGNASLRRPAPGKRIPWACCAAHRFRNAKCPRARADPRSPASGGPLAELPMPRRGGGACSA